MGVGNIEILALYIRGENNVKSQSTHIKKKKKGNRNCLRMIKILYLLTNYHLNSLIIRYAYLLELDNIIDLVYQYDSYIFKRIKRYLNNTHNLPTYQLRNFTLHIIIARRK